MPFIAREEPFICEHCHTSIQPLGRGSYRNHCPKCLCSKHVDRDGPGDRLSECLGIMKAEYLDFRSNKGWVIIHVCEKCQKTISNIPAPDDNVSLIMGKNSESA